MKTYTSPQRLPTPEDAMLLEAVWNDDHLALERLLRQQAAVNYFHYAQYKNTTVPPNIFENNLHRLMYSPLHDACALGHIGIATTLVQHGADINAKINGCTPLMQAAQYGQTEALETLIKNGANLDTRNGTISPLTAAAIGGHTETVKALLKAGVDVHDVHEYSWTSEMTPIQSRDRPLIEAAMRGHIDVMKALLESGADIGAHGNEALRTAQKFGQADAMKFLLDHGADAAAIASKPSPLRPQGVAAPTTPQNAGFAGGPSG